MNIAIAQNDNIGDLVVVLPFISALRFHFTESKIIFYGNSRTEDLIQFIAVIDEFRHIENQSIALIKIEDFDMCFFLGANVPLQVEKLFFMAGVPNRIAMRKSYKPGYLSYRAPTPDLKNFGHMALLPFKQVSHLGIRMPSLESLKSRQHAYFRTLKLEPYFEKGLLYVVLHTKSNKHGREWPVVRFNELKRRLNATGITAVFTGSLSEREEALKECPALLFGDFVVDLFGKTSVPEFLSVLKFSQATVCSGTGPLHLAAALDVNTIGLFPPYRGANASRWEPLGRFTTVLEGCSGCVKPWYRSELSQRHCTKFDGTCACMYELEEKDIYLAMLDRIRRTTIFNYLTLTAHLCVNTNEALPETIS